MKNQNQEMRFETVIPPSDVLENELLDILGGGSCTFSCGDFQCYGFNAGECGSFETAKADTDCPPGYFLMSSWCIKEEWRKTE